MSSINLGSINGAQTSSATYIQTNPTTKVNIGTTVTNVGLSFASNPWQSTPVATYGSGLKAKFNTDGSIQLTAPCVCSIKWGLVANLNNGGTSAFAIYTIMPSTTSSTATPAQLSNNTFPLYSNTAKLTQTASTLSSIAASFICKTGDVIYLAFVQPGPVQMTNGILEIWTTPLV